MRMEVFLNGERECTAGFDGLGVLVANVLGASPNEYLLGVLGGALDDVLARKCQNWIHDYIAVGDEVRMVVLGEGEITRPTGVIDDVTPFEEDEYDAEDDCDETEDGSESAETGGALGMKVYLNDALVCTAGFEGEGVLNVIVDGVRREPPSHDDNGWTLRVGGLSKGIHLRWARKRLSIGDEVRVVINGRGPFDDPEEASPLERGDG